MTSQWETIAQEGFHFFGKISASLSHEIKNALAIINESAGLLEDFALLAQNGRPIDPERLKLLASSVTKQIRRADELVKRMHRFAHSADQPATRIDVGETLTLVASVANRLASMREAGLEAVEPEKPIFIETRPFLLENLIWCCVDDLLAGGSKVVRLVSEEVGEEVRVRITGQPEGSTRSGNSFSSLQVNALLQVLNAEIRKGPVDGDWIISLWVKT
jgi:signal transduction histidine kinase